MSHLSKTSKKVSNYEKHFEIRRNKVAGLSLFIFKQLSNGKPNQRRATVFSSFRQCLRFKSRDLNVKSKYVLLPC